MFPKWFSAWNNANPTNVFGPGILVGAGFSGVLVAAVAVNYLDEGPLLLQDVQTGPPGIGMHVAYRPGDQIDPSVEDYYTEPPYPPEAGEPLAGEIYENVQVLAEVPEGNFLRLMNAITLWVSPDEGCAYCHAQADEGLYADDNLYTKVVSRRMIQMTQYLNDEWYAHVNANQEVGVNCYSCHRGENVPSDIWFRVDPVVQSMEGWGEVQNRYTVQSQYTSLPSDALYRYLYRDEEILVHDLDSRVGTWPDDPDVATWQDTERTFSLMNYYSNSLGVNCVFCHNSRAFHDASQYTPQWATAQLGTDMVRETNNVYLETLRDVYPPNRLGPVYGDAPKAACKTCHKGYNQPMNGLNAIADWPELAAPGAPDYSLVESAAAE